MKRIFVFLLAAPTLVFADSLSITGSTGVTVPGGSGAYFGLKRDDLSSRLAGRVLQYWTPNFQGLDAGISYGADKSSAWLSGGQTVANDLSFSLEYKLGQISAFVGSGSGWGGNPFGLTRSDVQLGAAYGFSTGTHFGLGYGQSR